MLKIEVDLTKLLSLTISTKEVKNYFNIDIIVDIYLKTILYDGCQPTLSFDILLAIF